MKPARSWLLALLVVPACASVIGIRDLEPGDDLDAGDDDDVQISSDGAATSSGGSSSGGSSSGDAAAPDAGCGDVTESAEHCGRCNHSCLGGDCVDSVCQPVVIASAQGLVASLALDAMYIYFSSLTNQTVARVPKAGGAVTVLAAAPDVALAKHIAVDGTHVYWGNSDCCGNAVTRCVVTGCVGAGAPAVESIAVASEPLGIALDATHVYWADRNGSKIERSGLDGGARELVANTEGAVPTSVAVRDGVVYWIGDFSGEVAHAVPPFDGGVDLGANGQSGRDLAVDDGYVYWGAAVDPGDPGRISRIARDGSGGVQLLGAAGGDPLTVRVDGTTVYWTAQRDPVDGGAAGGVYACDVTGCPPGGARVVAGGQDAPRGLALDADAIYWGVNGFVMKLAKPAPE